MKTCCKYKEIKDNSEYSENKAKKDGLDIYCKACVAEKNRHWQRTHWENYYQRNKAKLTEYKRQQYLLNKEKELLRAKNYREKNKEKTRISAMNWYMANKKKAYQHRKQRCKTDHRFRLRIRISHMIYTCLNSKKAHKNWESLLNYNLKDLQNHLQKQFQSGMCWQNYGRGKNKWHIDHKIPVLAFNFSKPEDIDFKKCWALSNLQPLWQVDNLSKRHKLSEHFQPSFSF